MTSLTDTLTLDKVGNVPTIPTALGPAPREQHHRSLPPNFTVTGKQAARITRAARDIARYDVRSQAESWIKESQVQSAHLPDSLRRQLFDFRRFGSDSGGFIIRGLPIGEIPATPSHADNSVAPTLLASAVLSLVVAALGDQHGFRAELGGNIVQSILPEKGAETSQRSVGASVYLKDHIEMAFTEYRADFVALLCVRADHDKQAGTALSSIYDILSALHPDTVSILREPRFKTTVDESFLLGWGQSDPIWIRDIALIEGPDDRPRLRVDFAETAGQDPGAEAALNALALAAEKVRKVCFLEPGDLFIADNAVATHGRTPFRPRFDGLDRWLLRTFVTKDLASSLAVRPNDGRVIDPDFRLWLTDEPVPAPRIDSDPIAGE